MPGEDKQDTTPQHPVCIAHSGLVAKVEGLEGQMASISASTVQIYGLQSRVNILITLIAFTFCSVLGGAIYSYTAIQQYKELDREAAVKMEMALSKQLNDMEKNMTQKNFDLVSGNREALVKLEQKLDTTLSILERRLTLMEQTATQTQQPNSTQPKRR